MKWIEDRTGNLISTGFARDVYLDGEMALRKDGKILGVRMHTDVRPRRVLLRRPAEQVQDRADALGVRLLRHPDRAPDRARASTRTRHPAAWPTAARSGSPRRCSSRSAWSQAAADDLGIDQAEFRRINFVRDDDFPHRTPFGFLTDSGQYAKCLQVGLDAIGYDDFRRAAGGGPPARPAARHRHLDDDRAARRGQQPRVRHPRHQDVRLRRAAGAHDRQGDPAHRRQDAGPGARDDVGPDRRPTSSASRPRTSSSRRATPTPRRSAWAPTPPAARRSPAPPSRWSRARCGPRRASSPLTCSRCPRRTSSGSSAGSTCAATRPRA